MFLSSAVAKYVLHQTKKEQERAALDLSSDGDWIEEGYHEQGDEGGFALIFLLSLTQSAEDMYTIESLMARAALSDNPKVVNARHS